MEFVAAEAGVERVYLAKARREGRRRVFYRKFDKCIYMVDFIIIRIINYFNRNKRALMSSTNPF